MSGLTSLVLNVVAGAYVPGAGRALGTRDNVEPQLLLAGWAGASGRTTTALLNLVGNEAVGTLMEMAGPCHSESAE